MKSKEEVKLGFVGKILLAIWITVASPLFFCLYWNVFQTYRAVGHHFGPVNFWTALGVSAIVATIVGFISFYFWYNKTTVEKYEKLTRR